MSIINKYKNRLVYNVSSGNAELRLILKSPVYKIGNIHNQQRPLSHKSAIIADTSQWFFVGSIFLGQYSYA